MPRRFHSRPPGARPPWVGLFFLLTALLAPAPLHASDASAAEGTIRVPYPRFGLLLMPVAEPGQEPRDEGWQEGEEGVTRLPAGRYHLMAWRVETTDKNGRRWRARGNAWPEPITVPAGGVVELPLGAPLQAQLQAVEANGAMHFHLEYAGTRGERCSGILVDGEAPAPPVVRIYDAKGTVIGRTRFKEKCGGTCHAAWPIPNGLVGRFRAVPEPRLGPLQLDVGRGVAFELKESRVVYPPPVVGRPAPDFTLITSRGQSLQLGFLKDQPVLLCFFCDCGLCRAFASALARAEDLARQARILVVASDAAVAEHESFRKETGLTAAEYFHDSPPVTAVRYASEECPRCWLIDTEGIVRYVNPERLMPAAKLVADLRAALAPPAPQPRPAPRPSARDAAKRSR